MPCPNIETFIYKLSSIVGQICDKSQITYSLTLKIQKIIYLLSYLVCLPKPQPSADKFPDYIQGYIMSRQPTMETLSKFLTEYITIIGLTWTSCIRKTTQYATKDKYFISIFLKK